MKTVFQLATSVVALAGLLGGAAANAATSVAELPLKASVLAKPNVIWGLDDSSSMDFEVMLNTNDGAFWWDYNAKSGWDATGTPWFYATGTSSTQWRKMTYLFPNGSAAGDRVNTDATNDHFAILPTRQFAWLRSSDYNPLYYNSTITYKPWSPAYTTASVSFTDATSTAAKSHPIFGTDTMNLTVNQALTSAANFTFMGLPGMIVPVGAQTCNYATSSTCTASTVVATEYTIAAGTMTKVTMAYYPATFYRKEACTYDGSACVYAPDGTTTLKRYEIKAGNTFPSGRTYAAEIQNFANWWQYFRKRKLMLNASIGQVLEPLTGLRMGVVYFNSRSTPTIYDIDSTSAATNGRKVAGLFYNWNGSGGTPTRETLKFIGDDYAGSSTPIQYACQRNNAFIVTDGFANASSPGVPAYDSGKSAATWGYGTAPYETIYSNSLADLALRYYTNNPKATLAVGKVPSSTTDTNTNLHMNTYGLTLGAKGTIFVDDTTAAPTSTAAWPNPNTDRSPTAVDDLWHATINGRGKMYTAATPQDTALKIQSGLNDILSQTGAQGGVAVSSVNLTRGDGYAYVGTYNPAGWSGDLTANAIDPSTAAISSTATWSASTKLTARDWTTRAIASMNGGVAAAFTEAGVGSLVNPSSTYGTTSQVMNYLRGDRSLEGTSFRTRTSLLGAVITAEPVISASDNVVFIATGEGMLHAFDTTPGANAGKELWAFVPEAVLADMGPTVQRGYAFKTQLDGTPVIGSLGGTSKLLVAGMGAAGKNYYALDVSTPRTNVETSLGWVKWQFPGGSTSGYASKVGQTLGQPVIVKATAGYRVLVTSGYNSTFDGKGRLFVLNPADGSVIQEFQTPAGDLTTEAGLAYVSAYTEDDGTVRYVYGGDLLGNLWRFDLTAATLTDATKVAVFKGPTGLTQPVTSAPELAKISGQRVIFVGTGRLLDVPDFGSSAVQTFYAITDGATLANARSSMTARTYTRGTDTIAGAAVDWTTTRGWYMDLTAGEQSNTRPAIAYGSVSFTTNVTGATDCTASGWFYVLDFKTGAKAENAEFVSVQVSSTANVSAVNAVVTNNGKLRGLMQTGDGVKVVEHITNGKTINASKNSWREIRQE